MSGDLAVTVIREHANAIGAELAKIEHGPGDTQQARIRRHLATRARSAVDALLAAVADLDGASRDGQHHD